MFRNMVTSLFEHGRIHTTDAKAKELRRWADRVITLAKRGDLHARRKALSIVRSKAVVHKLFEDVSSRFGQRAGGYTRIVNLGRRLGDAAPVSIVELVGPEEIKDKKKPKRKKSKKVMDQTAKQAAAKEKKPKIADKEEGVKTSAPEASEEHGSPSDAETESAAKPAEEVVAEGVEPDNSTPDQTEAVEDEGEEKVDRE
jgi:large subunit ribosomal protein L17